MISTDVRPTETEVPRRLLGDLNVGRSGIVYRDGAGPHALASRAFVECRLLIDLDDT